NEMFLSLVDETEKPIRSDIRTVAVDTLCTNRDLPLLMRFGKSESDFSGNTDAPVNTIKALISPTRPRNGPALGSLNWKFIRHLNLGYYGLSGSDTENIAALRDMLRLYVNQEQRHLSRLIDGIVGFEMTPITRRMPFAGPASIGRGIEIRIIFEDEALQGTSAIMVGNVIERFLARYVSINSFTQTCIETVNQGDIHRWPVRIGSRHAL
ncbi:MAG: type VI secretion system baseplate subunit TssF, partial [Pseudomonadota bacterium]